MSSITKKKNHHHHHHYYQQQQRRLAGHYGSADPGGGGTPPPSSPQQHCHPVACDMAQEDGSLASTMFHYHHHHHWRQQPVWLQAKRCSARSADLLTRPSWVDAETALAQIEKGRAHGNGLALWLRFIIQARFFELGHWIQQKAGAILFIASLILVVCLAGLKSVRIENNVEKLWIEEGGRLEKELQYVRDTLGEGYGTTSQMVIQTPKTEYGTVLNASALLYHLQMLRTATTTTVEMFDVTWSLKDVCYTPSNPSFDEHHIDSLLENIFPCYIITPLDCFWEGSKLLGPEMPVTIPGLGIKIHGWTELNPEALINVTMTTKNPTLDIIRKTMKRAGITTGYQNKPCLDPNDHGCPNTAPNKASGQPPDIGQELADGCHGFAANYMHWIEDLIVGGVQKDRSGQIVKARALQSVIQLMGERNMYEFHYRTFKVQNIEWSMEKARAILRAWQRRFAEEMAQFTAFSDIVGNKLYDVHYFTSASLTDIMSNVSELDIGRLTIGYLLMLIYAAFSLCRWRPGHLERSQAILGMLGVFIIGLAVAAGLGVCALIGLPFNATTTQIVPFLALGLGIDQIFLLAHVYVSDYMIEHIPHQLRTAECLKQCSLNLLLGSLGNLVAFCCAAIIPIPALRCFALQTAILLAFITIAVIVLFPALASIDLRFRSLHIAQAKDQTRLPGTPFPADSPSWSLLVLINMCCRSPQFREIPGPPPAAVSSQQQASNFSSNDIYRPTSHWSYRPDVADVGRPVICRCERHHEDEEPVSAFELVVPPRCRRCGGDIRTRCDGQAETDLSKLEEGGLVTPTPISVSSATGAAPASVRWFRFSTTHLVGEWLAPMLKRRPIKVLVLLLYLALAVISILGVTRLEDGLELTDVVPRGTNEYRFLELRRQYFSYYNILAVTKGNFDYPNNQRLLYEYYQAFNRIDAVIKNDDGGLPPFWLSTFRDWLLELQQAYDRDHQLGAINREQWFSNASADGILGYKLLVQTGRSDNPVDKSLVYTSRLVNRDGIINTKAFYNYLTAWVSNDVMAYGASQADLKPEPRQWIHDPQSYELRIPKSAALTYAQIPFHLNNIRTTGQIVATVQQIRDICDRFEERGLSNFPTGIPFTYWEQYIRLRFYMALALLAVLAGIFLATTALMCHVWTPTIIVFSLAMNAIHLLGMMGWIGIKLSALPAVILVVSVGVSLNSLIHITMSFITAVGSRNQRMIMALRHMADPVKNGILSSLFGVAMLAFSEFDFIVRYFFCVLAACLLIVTFNSFVLLPVLLSVIGPESEVIPLEHPDRISTPTPPPSPVGWPPAPAATGAHSRYIDALMLETGRHEAAAATTGSGRTRRVKPSSIFNRHQAQRHEMHRVQSQMSLSTISEEPSSYQSTPGATPTPPGANFSCKPHEFIMKPEFVVETTITNRGPTSEYGNGSRCSPTESTSVSSGTDSPLPSGVAATVSHDPAGTTTVTTKVMATAKLTVELTGGTIPTTATTHQQPKTLISFPGAARQYEHRQHGPAYSTSFHTFVPSPAATTTTEPCWDRNCHQAAPVTCLSHHRAAYSQQPRRFYGSDVGRR